MRILVSEKLSPHRFKTPEGYLICTDAILSRTGKQTYKRSEVFGQDCQDSDGDVEVDRTEKEVFSDATLASFENKPLTIEHPDENVNSENHNYLAVGFIRDIHRGEENGQPVMRGTIVVTNKDAVEAIENGDYEELSCGYDCDIADEEHPQQRNIRGNHVALCQQGRAGIARIVDSINDDVVFDYTEADLEKAKKMAAKAIDKEEKKLLETLVSKIEFELAGKKLNKDSINDVDPREGESKEDFISRFMEETKEEYPDNKQRLAVAYSYWDKNKLMKEKGKDSKVKDVDWDFLHKIREYDVKQIANAAKKVNLYRRIFEFDNSMNISYALIESRLSTPEKQKLLKALTIKDSIKDDAKHYAVYADGTMESNSRALYWRRSGKPKYSYLGEADLFTSDEADKICQQRGSYFWRKRYTDRVGDSLKKFEVHQKDSKGIEHIYIVKANSLADAIKKIK